MKRAPTVFEGSKGSKCFNNYNNNRATFGRLPNWTQMFPSLHKRFKNTCYIIYLCGRQYVIRSKWNKRCFCNPRISAVIASGLTLQNHMKINSGKSKEMIIRYAQDGNIQYTTESFAYFLKTTLITHYLLVNPSFMSIILPVMPSCSIFLNDH